MKREMIRVFLVFLAACSASLPLDMPVKVELKDNTTLQNNLGETHRRIGESLASDYAEALKWVRKAAEQGDDNAQYFLGVMYYKGEGVPLDYAEAATWYRKAAEHGNVLAQLNLGWAYNEGEGVTRDYDEAMSWYRKAAEQGNAVAQNNLGWMYEEGKGVPRDLVTAYMWYSFAAAQGQERAKSEIDSIERKMTQEQIAEAQKRAEEANGAKRFRE
ncbi:tetratricopeptide repeat protein [Candidatus Methylospira mobilis]|uniref:tetratricopeptide repeat protein n=1 Tax=Candidatus Methylospira mobilis TaxID=1808979 RepID=UPI0028F080D4|nr:tetratricopeptide repeat protein [Candidatus Methylospira mobilis]WNV04704.1 tetratricopeptide repeat protein [Candidatus Methylospira mobilis]